MISVENGSSVHVFAKLIVGRNARVRWDIIYPGGVQRWDTASVEGFGQLVIVTTEGVFSKRIQDNSWDIEVHDDGCIHCPMEESTSGLHYVAHKPATKLRQSQVLEWGECPEVLRDVALRMQCQVDIVYDEQQPGPGPGC